MKFCGLGGAFLFLAVTVLGQSRSDGKVDVETLAEAGRFAVAVRVHDVPGASRAIVTYQFWEQNPTYGRLLRTKVEVVEVVADEFVMGNGVEAERSQIRNVDVVLVKDLEKHSFKFSEVKP